MLELAYNIIIIMIGPWSCSMNGVLQTHYMECIQNIIIIAYMYNNNTQEHIADCKFTKLPCPNKQHGCTKLLLQSQWEEHLERECRFIPVQCPWCSKKVHNKEVNFKNKHFCAWGVVQVIPRPGLHACRCHFHRQKSRSTESHQAGVWSCSRVLQ